MWLVELLIGLVSGLVQLLWTAFSANRIIRVRGSLEELQSRYRGSTVRRVEFPYQEATSSEPTVEFVVANRAGLSFRDGYGGELVRVPATDIERLAPLPGDGSLGYGWDVLRRSGAAPTRFWSADDIATDLTAALSR